MKNGGRLGNVRFKDAYLRDSLTNAINGMGTSKDPRMANAYAFRTMSTPEIAAAYQGSGLMRKIINIPAVDMVREWRSWNAPADDIGTIEKEEKRLKLRQKVRRAEVLRGLGGAAMILGLPGNPQAPAPNDIKVGQLLYIHVLHREQLRFDALQDDARLPGYGEPTMWRMMSTRGTQPIHPSRVIPFRADLSAPTMGLNSVDEYWGESRVQQVIDAVQDCDSARQAFAALVQKARNTRIGIPNLLATVADPAGEASFQRRMSAFSMAESLFNATVYDKGHDGDGEEISDATYHFAGVKDVMNAFKDFACAVSDIPHTRLWGTAPEGMNSSGESQQTDWNKMIGAKQELELEPCLDVLDPFLLQSALGRVDPEIWSEFDPLDQETETQTADRFVKLMTGVTALIQTGTIPEEAMVKGVQSLMTDEGFLPGLEGALAELPEDVRFGVLPTADPDDIDETDAPPTDNTAVPLRRRAANDAQPRSLYVRRDLLNGAEFVAWAKGQGFESTTPADQLHVTIAYSKAAIDWMKVGQDWHSDESGHLTVAAGGARIVEPLGDKGAIVLLFNSSALAYRHEAIIGAGASTDYADYQPHVTITYQGSGIDLSKVEPFRGVLRFGPEIFEEIEGDWASTIVEE